VGKTRSEKRTIRERKVDERRISLQRWRISERNFIEVREETNQKCRDLSCAVDGKREQGKGKTR
jgi:hypothetical protein